jgi:ABC-type transporter Mla MlaB component
MDAWRLRIEGGPSGELVLAGELDQLTAPLLRVAFEQAVVTGGALVVDLQQVCVLQAAGVAVLDEHARRHTISILGRAGSATALVLTVCGMQLLARVELRAARTPPTRVACGCIGPKTRP